MNHVDGRDKIVVVVACYRVPAQIEEVILGIGDEVHTIIAVNDACPDGSGEILDKLTSREERLQVIHRDRNGGVGAAVKAGYQRAVELDADVIVKLDGDGQMDPGDIPLLVAPIIKGDADYTKGNRFFELEHVQGMPLSRIVGNAGLSFFSKISTGYWKLFDPTNGFTAIAGTVARALPLDKIANRYFFESDVLFRLGLLRAVCIDIPMAARYGEETSGLSTTRALWSFPLHHVKCFMKRIFYNYFLRNFSLASISLAAGSVLLLFGVIYGSIEWLSALERGTPSAPGVVMLAGLPVILGSQGLLNFLSFDIANEPRQPLSPYLRSRTTDT